MEDLNNEEIPSQNANSDVDEIDSNEKTNQSASGKKNGRLTNSEKKYLRYQKKVANYKLKREEKKRQKALKRELDKNESNQDNQFPNEKKQREENDEDSRNSLATDKLNKRQQKKLTIERLKNTFECPENCLKITIDCSFNEKMSAKEQSRLAQQIGRCYATNRSLEKPVYLTLCNLDTNSKFYAELLRVNDGFVRYFINTTKEPIENYYSASLDTLVYLSPDSKSNLEEVSTQSTYVIGGLVDETVTKKVTLSKCEELKLVTRSLPIEKYMVRKQQHLPDEQKPTYNKILTVNQVFDILVNFHVSKSWPQALDFGVPKRKGFVVNKSVYETEVHDGLRQEEISNSSQSN
jgi:tRNA (guanine9-N1)-methyltransferase